MGQQCWSGFGLFSLIVDSVCFVIIACSSLLESVVLASLCEITLSKTWFQTGKNSCAKKTILLCAKTKMSFAKKQMPFVLGKRYLFFVQNQTCGQKQNYRLRKINNIVSLRETKSNKNRFFAKNDVFLAHEFFPWGRTFMLP